MTDLLAVALIAAGLFFQGVAAVGLVRFPDVYSRLHAIGTGDSLGIPLVLAGAAVHLGWTPVSFRLVLALFFLFLIGPLTSHLLSRAALEGGVPNK